MKIIKRDEFCKEITRLMNQSNYYYWSVAWARSGFEGFNLLLKNKAKIKKIIIGTHFYQTDPIFIEKMYVYNGIRFNINPAGIFHPKLYFFEYNNGTWECIIGSNNFTFHAFEQNTELAVLFSYEDDVRDEHKNKILRFIDSCWNSSKKYAIEDVEDYKIKYSKTAYSRTLISSQIKSGIKESVLEILNLDWATFYYNVSQHELNERILLLGKANDLFKINKNFESMTEDERKCLAGLENNDIDGYSWWAFGTMRGNGYFKKAIRLNNLKISEALDSIPMIGIITKKNYTNCAKLFLKAIREQNNPLASLTRLLAMKRPDYFVCLNNANRVKLIESFECKKGININNYWDEIINRIINSKWWNDNTSKKEIEGKVFSFRSAFLDNLFYRFFQ